MTDRVINVRKDRLRIIVPLVHFLASFLYERLIFNFSKDRSVVLSVARNNIISDNFEFVESYVFSKLFALIFIFLIWKIVFYVYDHLNKTILIHLVIFVVGLVVVILSWPSIFEASEDNLVTLSYALRFYPEYWHSAYSSFIYAGLMMAIPNPIAVSVLQWFFLVSAAGYLSVRIEKSPKLKGAGVFVPYIMVIVPEWFLLASNAYRTEQYAILCFAYMAILCMDAIDKKHRKPTELILILLTGALISVWRSEGIILGFISFFMAIVFIYGLPLKKILVYMAGFMVAFIIVAMPQKLGDKKYYGKDYSFINSFPTLTNILNSNGGVLKEYDGLMEDLAAIDKVVPIELVKAYGMEGYRRYNYSNGRNDINQSLCDEETSSAYMAAYYRLVLHNPKIYIKTQVSMLLYIAGIKDYTYVERATDLGDFAGMDNYYYAGWDIGRSDLDKMPFYTSLKNSESHQLIANIIIDTFLTVRFILKRMYIRTLMLVLLPTIEAILFVVEFIKLIKRKKHLPGIAGFAMALLGQAVAISLVMPAAVIAYFHAYLFSSFVVVAIYCVNLRLERIEKQLPNY